MVFVGHKSTMVVPADSLWHTTIYFQVHRRRSCITHSEQGVIRRHQRLFKNVSNALVGPHECQQGASRRRPPAYATTSDSPKLPLSGLASFSTVVCLPFPQGSCYVPCSLTYICSADGRTQHESCASDSSDDSEPWNLPPVNPASSFPAVPVPPTPPHTSCIRWAKGGASMSPSATCDKPSWLGHHGEGATRIIYPSSDVRPSSLASNQQSSACPTPPPGQSNQDRCTIPRTAPVIE